MISIIAKAWVLLAPLGHRASRYSPISRQCRSKRVEVTWAKTSESKLI